jgi:DNA mismatch endonuclease (patch repair protein)
MVGDDGGQGAPRGRRPLNVAQRYIRGIGAKGLPVDPGRSRTMAAIRSIDTGPERSLRRALRSLGLLGYRCHHRALPGRPDIVFTRWRVAVFVDGAFWHGHPDFFQFGKLGTYWDNKIGRTQERDAAQQAALDGLGFQVVRFWDFDVDAEPTRCALAVADALASAGNPTARRLLDRQRRAP